MTGDLSRDLEKDMPDSEKDVEREAVSQPQHQSEAAMVEQSEAKDSWLVEFDSPDDPDNPKNWSVKRRTIVSAVMGLMTFVVTFSSSLFAVCIEPVAEQFNNGIETATLGVSLFLLVSTLNESFTTSATNN